MTENVGLLVFLIIAAVVLFNIGLYFYAQRRKPGGQVELMQKAARAMSDPFAKDNADLEELSRLVKGLSQEEKGAEE
ncbi:MAG: hypothetical protein Fur0018_05920 [Anaerolineales bacterium]